MRLLPTFGFAVHGGATVTTALARADELVPSASAIAPPPLASALATAAPDDGLIVCVATYAVTLVVLVALQIASGGRTLPVAPDPQGALTRDEREQTWLTPEVVAVALPDEPPARPVFVGAKLGVKQYIVAADDVRELRGVVERHAAWTARYGRPIVIFKRKTS